MAVLIILGIVWYGISADVERRIWHNIVERPHGPMAFRFLLQPIMAFIAALHDGIHDARLGRPSYFRTIVHDPGRRTQRIREGFLSTGRIILLGLGMDAVYQYQVLNTFFPGEMVLTALLLAFVPYLLLRGIISRTARWWILRHPQSAPLR
ncbi:hypothetical protein [Microvirga calopogonii]|uniref:hypothetical protein n=1 Tax=Microvirga calopogonii TaxID=2078013 RepID=UPI001FDF1D38|nr:hypothetical protein [Microvirga calopogonii]